MSKNDIVFGFVGIGFSVWAFVIAYDRYYCSVCPFADTALFLLMAISCMLLAIWYFTLPYCFTYRFIDAIFCENGKLKFNCGGKSFEDTDHVFVKFKLHTEESPTIPTHMFILLKSGPWICPFALWGECVKAHGLK